MILIGLQNSERTLKDKSSLKYEKTRHNAGAIVLKYLVESGKGEFALDKYTNAFKAHSSYSTIYLPNTFMNLSGESVQKIVKNEEIESKDLIVFFDDVTLPVGEFKVSVGVGASSHNGIKSIIESLGGKNDFTRVRIGVGKILPDGKVYEPGPEKLADFVLSNLNAVEISQIQSLVDKILPELRK